MFIKLISNNGLHMYGKVFYWLSYIQPLPVFEESLVQNRVHNEITTNSCVYGPVNFVRLFAIINFSVCNRKPIQFITQRSTFRCSQI
jgi:hypothetical protein